MKEAGHRFLTTAFCVSSFYYDNRSYLERSSLDTSPCGVPSPCAPSRNIWPAHCAPESATVGGGRYKTVQQHSRRNSRANVLCMITLERKLHQRSISLLQSYYHK